MPEGGNPLRARIKHINAAGALVKVELVTERGESVRVEMSQERFRSLSLERELEVFITPKEIQVFPNDIVDYGANI